MLGKAERDLTADHKRRLEFTHELCLIGRFIGRGVVVIVLRGRLVHLGVKLEQQAPEIAVDALIHLPGLFLIVKPHQGCDLRPEADPVFKRAHIIDVGHGLAQKIDRILTKLFVFLGFWRFSRRLSGDHYCRDQ